MGESQSRPVTADPRADQRGQEKFVAEEKPIVNQPSQLMSVELITKVSLAVCKVNDNGTGFLGKFLCKNELCYGLFTNNHVLTEEMLCADETIRISFYEAADGSEKETIIHLNNTFRFTCSLLDVTFIRFDEKLVEVMTKMNRNFLPLLFTWTGRKGDQLMVIQNPGNRSGQQVATGTFYRLHGFDIFHRVTTDYGSSGSPVVTHDGNVVGVHKRRALKAQKNYNVAVSSKAVLHAIYHHGNLSNGLVCNPRLLDKLYEDRVLQQNLQFCPDNPAMKFLVYICQPSH